MAGTRGPAVAQAPLNQNAGPRSCAVLRRYVKGSGSTIFLCSDFGCRTLVASRPSHAIRCRSTVDEGEVELICDAKRRAAVSAARRVWGLEAEFRGLTHCAAEGG